MSDRVFLRSGEFIAVSSEASLRIRLSEKIEEDGLKIVIDSKTEQYFYMDIRSQ